VTDLTRMSAAELAKAIAGKEASAVEVATAHLDRIDAVDDRVHAFLHVDREGALAAAERVDRGEVTGPLAGVPIAVKDVIATKGVPTTAASKILEGWRPPYDATIVQRLRAAGMVMLGKTNMDEFAMGSSTEYSAYGPTNNPWDLGRIPGGSGGGSAASLAAYEAPLAIGTDTGGSIRQPGAVTGTVGAKPTYGGTSRYGLIAFSSSLDTPGPCARNVEDAALQMQDGAHRVCRLAAHLHEVVVGIGGESRRIEGPFGLRGRRGQVGRESARRQQRCPETGGKGSANHAASLQEKTAARRPPFPFADDWCYSAAGAGCC